MPEKAEILRAISNSFYCLRIDPWVSEPASTTEVKTKLCEIGQDQFGCYVRTSGVQRADDREWLYDVTWLKCDGDSLIDVHLVAESEWNQYRIDEDFQKLLLARTSVRVMIFGGWDGCGTERKLDRMASQIKEFNRSCDEDAWLLVACEGSGTDSWSFKSSTIQDNVAIPFPPSSEGWVSPSRRH